MFSQDVVHQKWNWLIFHGISQKIKEARGFLKHAIYTPEENS